MADPPRLTKLGAKWVEVRKRRGQGFRSGMWGRIENVASNTRWKHSPLKPEGFALNLSELLLLTKGSSRGRSAIQDIADCELPIADFEGVPLSSSNVVIGW